METRTFLMTSSYYPPYHIGGDATHVKYLSEELLKLGHEVHVMFSLDAYNYKKSDFKGSLKEIEERNGVFLHPLQSHLGQTDLYLTYLLGRSAYIKKNCLSCTFMSKRLPQMWRKSKGFMKAIGDIDTFIAPSNFMKKKLTEWLPGKANIVHIPHFVSHPPQNIKDSGYANYFLYVGVLEKPK